MKSNSWFSRNRLFSHLRLSIAVTLFSAGVAMAFVAAKTSSPLFTKSGDHREAINKFRQDADARSKPSRQTVVGNFGENDLDPASVEEEAFAERAYPAEEISFEQTLAAEAAFNQVKARGVGKGKKVPGLWTLSGPSTANYPGVLNRTGADYTTSGRITALAIAPGCSSTKCRLWVAAAGGGIWRTDNALSGSGASWTFLSASFATNAIGTLSYDAAHATLYAGTGEPNASGDSEAGRGIYKSIDGGTTWTKLVSQVTNLITSSCALSNSTGACTVFSSNGTYTGDAFANRSISSIRVDPTNPNTLYVSSTRGIRGVTSVTGGGSTNPPTPRPPYGLFKSTDGGASFTFIWDGNVSVRGVNHIELDPSNANIVYAAAFQQGIWRSTDAGVTFTQIKTPLNPGFNTDRAEFSVTASGGSTRMFVGVGASGGAIPARFYRTDDAAGAATFTDMTTDQTVNYCTGQCWYDNAVVSPAGNPDTVYLLGSYQYPEYGGKSNSRGVLYSTDGGVSFTDVSWDALTPANGIHPDQHALVVSSTNPGLFFEGSDGGLMRSSGSFTDTSSQCTSRGLTGTDLTFCQGLLSRVPTQLFNLNKGLSTLQFQSLSVAADNSKHLQGGTQDNGTFETYGSAVVWPQIIYGDGGQSGFSITNSSQRFNSFFGQNHDANFQNGDPTKWVIISAPIAGSVEGSNFYAPIIADPNPASAGTIFQGSQSVWRTQDWGGNQAYLEANCPEFTTSGTQAGCGDFVQIGPVGATDLTGAAYTNALTPRSGGFVAAVERAKSDTGTLWAATTTGRVLISKNADAAASSVTYTRLDTLPGATADPARFVSSIYIDPANPNHAWIS